MDARVAFVEQTVPTRFADNVMEPITATFTYRPDDPYAATVLFTTRQGDSEWTFSRDLLRDGLSKSSGVGDVHVAPATDDQVFLDLRPPEGATRLVCDRAPITSFVARMFAAIPEGEEPGYAQMDNWLADLCA